MRREDRVLDDTKLRKRVKRKGYEMCVSDGGVERKGGRGKEKVRNEEEMEEERTLRSKAER